MFSSLLFMYELIVSLFIDQKFNIKGVICYKNIFQIEDY